MKQKPQAKKKQYQSESEHSEEFIVGKIHSQKTNTPKNGMTYLVEFKNLPSKAQWVWKTEQELLGIKGFKKELKKFLASVGKPKNGEMAKSNIVPEEKDKKLLVGKNQSTIGEYEVDKEMIREKLKKVMAQKQQQASLQTFLKPIPKQQPTEHNQANPHPTLPTTKPLKPNPPPSPTKPHQQKPNLSQQWIDKIKGIKTIKGYQVKNGELQYQVDVWDKNGQTLFVPPLSSQMVKKIDEVKLAMFWQECLYEGWRERQGVMERE